MSKKISVFISVLFLYVIYSIGIRHERPIIAKPASLASVKTPSSTSTSTSTPATSSSSPSSTSSSATSSKSSTSVSSSPPPAKKTSTGQYSDGTYTGSSVNVYYGNVQVSVTISSGKISDVKFLSYPNSHSTSVYINQQVMPYLKQEAIKSQNSNVQVISGATFTSEGFIQSLSAALKKA